MSTHQKSVPPPLADTPLVFIDLETTGTRATRDRVTEIAALRVVDGEIVDRFVSLVDPGVEIPVRIAALTGIDNDLVAGAPTFAALADEFEAWLGNDWLVAHNARFDYSFLRNEFRRLGRGFQRRVVCTLKLSRSLEPGFSRHGLDVLIERHGLDFHPPRHRALGDSLTLFSLWQFWARHHSVDTIERQVLEQNRHRSLPAQLDAGLLDELPGRPGVYLFYGHNELPLYVGKSVNLRSRVLSHFSSDHRNDREMKICQQTQDLKWHETAGDLGAQLLEARLVKTLSPIYNRKLRRSGALKTWYWPEGAKAPELAGHEVFESRHNDSGDPDNERSLDEEGPGQTGLHKKGGTGSAEATLYGMFRSRKEAIRALTGIAEQQKLCPKVLGLERGSGRCFAYQIRRCHGACCGEESLEAHSARARQALERLRVQCWPWPGRVAFRERAEDGETVYHLVDQWCYLGSVDSLTNAPPGQRATFDVDTYKILTHFLRHEKASIDVIPLS